jgi:hypothetical protein
MRRKKNALFVLILLILVTLACANATPQVDPPGEEGDPASGDSQEPVGQTRSNPAPAGSQVTLGDVTLAVTGLTRPADDIVREGNIFNPLADDGMEYILVRVALICNKGADQTCAVAPLIDLHLVGSRGVEYQPRILLAGVSGVMEGGEWFGGATLDAYLPYIIGQEEGGLILIYQPLLSPAGAYLRVE